MSGRPLPAARASIANPDAPRESFFESVLNALVDPVLIISPENRISGANSAAEQFFSASQAWLTKRSLDEIVAVDSPLHDMIAQVRRRGAGMQEYGVGLGSPRTGDHVVTIQVSPIADDEGMVVVSLHDRTIASRMTGELSSRSAARSLTGMAAVLAHEVKNPLSGIRGAAQLLEQNAGDDDRVLTRLICDETDRICSLVDSMEAFSADPRLKDGPVNIHKVLDHVRLLAENGFGPHIRFVERYDPSLPPALGNRDQLIQVFLNLVKNAVEAAPEQGGEIVLRTGYQHGLRIHRPGHGLGTQLPLLVSIADNGPGIPEDLQPHLFDPFVTTKPSGTGLGLALVAKIISDHGGMIELSSEPGRTEFRVYLPLCRHTATEEESPGESEPAADLSSRSFRSSRRVQEDC